MSPCSSQTSMVMSIYRYIWLSLYSRLYIHVSIFMSKFYGNVSIVYSRLYIHVSTFQKSCSITMSQKWYIYIGKILGSWRLRIAEILKKSAMSSIHVVRFIGSWLLRIFDSTTRAYSECVGQGRRSVCMFVCVCVCDVGWQNWVYILFYSVVLHQTFLCGTKAELLKTQLSISIHYLRWQTKQLSSLTIERCWNSEILKFS